MSVRAFQPRSIDPPHFVAEDRDELEGLVGGFVGGEQCDGCGNHEYRVEQRNGHFYAVCAVEDASSEFAHPEPCGHAWPISIWDDEEVVY